jgi:hypothetical protein
MEFVLGINQKKLERENQELEQEPEQEKGPAPVEHAEPIPEQDIEQ